MENFHAVTTPGEHSNRCINCTYICAASFIRRALNELGHPQSNRCAVACGAWLHWISIFQIDEVKPDVVLYPFGSRNPPGFAAWSQANAGVKQSENWQEFLITHSSDVEKLTALFNEMDTDGSGEYLFCYRLICC